MRVYGDFVHINATEIRENSEKYKKNSEKFTKIAKNTTPTPSERLQTGATIHEKQPKRPDLDAPGSRLLVMS